MYIDRLAEEERAGVGAGLRGLACGASHSRGSGQAASEHADHKEVELVKHDELVAELVKLHQHDRRRELHRAIFQSSASVWMTAWPTPTRRMSNSQLAVHAAWYMGVPVGLLQPMIGRKLRKAGTDRGTVDEHEISITCTTLCELKDIRSDRSHANYNGAAVTGVEKREIKIPIEIQKQAVDLDEKMFGVWLHRQWSRGSGSSTSWTG
jgi:hypothetical protein